MKSSTKWHEVETTPASYFHLIKTYYMVIKKVLERMSEVLGYFLIKSSSGRQASVSVIKEARYKCNKGNFPRRISCQSFLQTATQTLKQTCSRASTEFHRDKHAFMQQLRRSLHYLQQPSDFCVWWPDLKSPFESVEEMCKY